jgi:hypothetical protein
MNKRSGVRTAIISRSSPVQPMTAKSGAVYVDEICPACRMVVAWVSHGKEAWAAKLQAREVLEGR